MGKSRLAAYARMADMFHHRRGEAFELPPVVLLTPAGTIRGKVTSVWGYLSRLGRQEPPEDETARAIVTTLLTEPEPQADVTSSPRKVTTLYLADVTVTLPGALGPNERYDQLAVSLEAVVAWTLENPSLAPEREQQVPVSAAGGRP